MHYLLYLRSPVKLNGMKLLLLATLLVASMGAVAQKASIAGRITDSSGAAIGNARVLVHWDPAGSTVGLKDNVGVRTDVSVKTDANGDYSIIVPPGFYDVFVSSSAFTPVAAKVRVKDRQSSRFDTRLKIDSLVSKELGDTF